jgi:alkylation response protein AidB-like acyl-CoA dehydrogenase
MPLVLNEEQQALKESAETFFKEKSPVDVIRKLRDSNDATGFDRAVWKQIGEMGWAATIIPENYGGLDFGFVGFGVVLEAAGRTLAPTPLFSSVALGASAILLAGSEQQKVELLPLIASGEKIFTFALQETAVHNPRRITCRAEKTSNGFFRINGKKTFVTDGNVADTLVVAVRTNGESSDKNGMTLLLVDRKAKGVNVHPSVMVDTRNLAMITFDNVDVPVSAVLGEVDNANGVIHKIIDRGNIALCAEMLGSIEAAFEQTLAYIKQRVQFDQPIGSFQALQHRAAQMFCEIELAKSMVLRALDAVDEEVAGKGMGDLPLMASAAKVHLCDTYRLVSNEGIQMHGGMGMTDEMDIGLYIKRARVAMQTLGDENYHLQRYATLRGY